MNKINVLLCICILLCFSACTKEIYADVMPTDAEEVYEIVIPKTLQQLCNQSSEEMRDDFINLGEDYCTDCIVRENEVYLYVTEEQKQKLVNRFNGYIDGWIEEFLNLNDSYRFECDEKYQSVTYYYDEKMDKSYEFTAVYAVVTNYAMNYVLTTNDPDWNVHFKIYNCHTNKLVAEGDVAYEKVSWDDEDWARSYE